MSATQTGAGRLSIWQAAFVIARRDFTAIVLSRSFLFFVLGPLFPLAVMGLAAGIGQQAAVQADQPQIGVAMLADDAEAMVGSYRQLAAKVGYSVPEFVVLEKLQEGQAFDAETQLLQRKGNLAGIVTGTPAAPVFTATQERLRNWSEPISLIAANATSAEPQSFPRVTRVTVATSGAAEKQGRSATARAGQGLLFLLIMLLAGMVLSNLVEEKGNKIIEVLAAAIPMNAVFLGKLFAMLAVSFCGILVWGTAGTLLIGFAGTNALDLPTPGVGWPMFFALGVIYFSMGYLLLGSIFLAIGSMAATVREVQTLSMPVTMLQLVVFFFANYAMNDKGSGVEMAAIVFPLSSPFVMLARAAQEEALWPHLLAIGWQVICVALFVRFGAELFRRRVMKSGPSGVKKKRGLLSMLRSKPV